MDSKTLVYLGCNAGFGLARLLQQYKFDKLLLIEANPAPFRHLINRFNGYPGSVFINKCIVTDPNVKTVKFYETNNSVSSSVLEPPNNYYGGLKTTIEVEAAYLPDILAQNGIDHIDFYISDIQGNDFNVLTTLSDYITNKKIGELFIETHNSVSSLYKNCNNTFSNFFNLLHANYKIDYFSADGTILQTTDDVIRFVMNNNHSELDTHWSCKELQKMNYVWN